jgi:hypothetical protein
MTTSEFLFKQTREGNTLHVQDGKLHCKHPVPVSDLREHKAAILEMVAKQPELDLAIKDHLDCQQTAKIDTAWGEIWIVPEKTDMNRFEVEWREMDDTDAVVKRCREVLLAATLMDGKLCKEDAK